MSMKAFSVILAMSIGFISGPANALGRAEAHLDCTGLYALLKMAAPTFAELAEERMNHARQSYFRDLPFPSPVPMPLTTGEMEVETRARMQARSGRFNNVSEVVRAGLRLLEEQEQRKQLELDALRAEIAAGRASGPGKPADDIIDRLEAKYAAMSKER